MHDIMTGPVHMVMVVLELAAAGLLVLGFVLATVIWGGRLLRGDTAQCLDREVRRLRFPST